MVLGVQVAAGGSSLIRLVRRSFTCAGAGPRRSYTTASAGKLPDAVAADFGLPSSLDKRDFGSTAFWKHTASRAAGSLCQFSTAASGTGCRERQPLL
jgi:hypothetical protein